MVTRHAFARKRFAAENETGHSDFAGLDPKCGLRAVLGVPGRTGAAHIVQFRSVGIESPGEELAPEGHKAGGAGLSVPAKRGSGEGG